VSFDVAIVGSGPAGYRAAIAAAHLGARVALIERGVPGGTCLNEGCIPKKALVRLASLLEDVAALSGRGLAGAVQGDFRAALGHKDEVVAGIGANFSFWLKRLGVTVLAGSARIAATAPEFVLDVRAAEGGVVTPVHARKLILATGARPKRLAGFPVDGRRILDSRGFLDGREALPGRMLFVGGGPIGVEFGWVARQFGAQVTIAEAGERLLPRLRIPERAVWHLARKLGRCGVALRLGVAAQSALAREGDVTVEFSDGTRADYDAVVVAVGREPCTAGLGLEEAGIALTPEGFVRTTEYLETSVAGVYAAGDVKPGPMTANAALHDAKIAAANAVRGNRLRANYLRVPVVINSALEIAAVGLDEDAAEDAGFEPDVARSSLRGSGKARAHHDVEGFIDVVHDAETGQLLGGSIVGPEAGEQIHLLAAACHSERGLWFFKDMHYSHPSWCEELEAAVDPYAAALDRSGRDIFERGIFAPAL
jgi:dihydrolipoamide dehydrogenase